MSDHDDHDGGGGGGHGAVWLVSYADMVTLIMAFFVVMYTMSQVDAEKMRALVDSMHSAFAPTLGGKEAILGRDPKAGGAGLVTGGAIDPPKAPPLPPRASKDDATGASRAEQDLAAVVGAVQQVAKATHLENQLKSEVSARGAVISFAETAEGLSNVAPFGSGSAALNPEFRRVLDRLAPVLEQVANKIEVQGHTDVRPIHTPAYPSNWELSAARAGSVVRHFVQTHGLSPRQFVCTGFADTTPADRGNTPAAWAHNRRIEIVITRQPVDAYDQLSRDQVVQQPRDITQPLGSDLVMEPTPPAH